MPPSRNNSNQVDTVRAPEPTSRAIPGKGRWGSIPKSTAWRRCRGHPARVLSLSLRRTVAASVFQSSGSLGRLKSSQSPSQDFLCTITADTVGSSYHDNFREWLCHPLRDDFAPTKRINLSRQISSLTCYVSRYCACTRKKAALSETGKTNSN